ncbi:hypothetical protein CDAR_74241 [Caerostris darwini]|uniref:Uncharacterized protein n=1 Tax=Caerostris darwini TaxID=1538125 RepID=A0AAV4UJV9_9ARAC|nr:hypothetical protein CDAR_74241 [Caerostris darwini]
MPSKTGILTYCYSYTRAAVVQQKQRCRGTPKGDCWPVPTVGNQDSKYGPPVNQILPICLPDSKKEYSTPQIYHVYMHHIPGGFISSIVIFLHTSFFINK